MKKLLDSYGARVLAFLLCCLFAMTAIACAAGFAYVYYEPGMDADSPRNFAGSELADNYAREQLWYVFSPMYHRNEYLSQTSPGDAADESEDVLYFPDPDSGFSCVIRDGKGKIVEDTRIDGSQKIDVGVYEMYGYSAEAYINLPVGRNTELYGYVTLYDLLYNGRNLFLPVGLAAGLLTLLLFIFLMAAAGRTPEGVKLGGFHRWPLELYLGGLVMIAVFFAWIIAEIGYRSVMRELLLYGTALTVGILGIGVAVLLGCMTLAARFRGGKWWRNTVVFFCLTWGWRIVKWCWSILRRICGGAWKGAVSLARAIPLTWKAILAYGGFVLLNFILAINGIWNGEGWFVLLFLIDAAALLAVIWVAMQLKKLQAAGRAMAAGDLSYAVDTKRMLPVLREHAENLSAVSLGMTKAVNERMKSERFKTELITNVSHDLKTPLTSIVSYVDLLKSCSIEDPQAREYIDVLDRQSQRLKKLTTDLVDASKASSGVLNVNMETVDLAELVRQSSGEFAERFALAQLESVLNLPEGEWVIRADGRLLWRVLDNLLTNVVKYALPGTRVYMDLSRQEGKTILSLKNISREALNIPAEELMERFVRGDASRSTDGSGLGLSIARSLMELMGGQLRLTLDGDLFKAELIFP